MARKTRKSVKLVGISPLLKLRQHRRHLVVVALSMGVAHGLIILGREGLLHHLEIALALAGVGVIFTD